MKVTCVAGARPNFMKVKPVLGALEARKVDCTLLHTGQHYDEEMSEVFFKDLGLRPPDVSLESGSGSHAQQTARVMTQFEAFLDSNHMDVVVVVGDVNSTLACALVAAKAGCLVAHVEAGLRSRSWDMPEEINRVVTDRVSDYLFAPSADAVRNLESEGYRGDQIHLVGNVMVDTLLSNLDRAKARPIVSSLGLEDRDFGLVTLHRPSNVDIPETLHRVLSALGSIATDLPIILPAHPRLATRLNGVSLPEGVTVISPLGYLDFVALEASARIVFTDSGGVQEETTVLGIPCLTLRNSTERPITVDEGTNRIVGTNPERIIAAAQDILTKRPPSRVPDLWDGQAGNRIAEVLLSDAMEPSRLRPTDLSPL